MGKQQIGGDVKKQIIELHLDGMSSREIANELSIKLSDSSIRRYLRIWGYGSPQKEEPRPKYTHEQHIEIATLFINDKWDELYEKYPNINRGTVRSISSRLHFKKEQCFWSEEEINYLVDNYNKFPVKYFVEYFNNKYSDKSITNKAISLGLTKPRDWSEEENYILLNNYSNIPMQELLKLLPNRTQNSIIDRAKVLGMKSYYYLSRVYTDEEKQFIIDNWNSMSDEQIANALDRTATAIMEQRQKMNLYKINREYSKYENLSKMFRGQIMDWKRLSMITCNYQCVLTGSKNFEVHHLYSFNKILEEAFKLIEKEIELVSDITSDYTKEQLDRMIVIFKEVHSKYPLGNCVRKDLHDLFHKIYGAGGNTPEQWNRFVEDYKNGKIIT